MGAEKLRDRDLILRVAADIFRSRQRISTLGQALERKNSRE